MLAWRILSEMGEVTLRIVAVDTGAVINSKVAYQICNFLFSLRGLY
jgi:hypothetical protein